MVKIAHEAPITIMDEVRSRTDYDYALVHLFETHPKYLRHFKQSVELGRDVILDNSIFELGEAFDADRYAHWIRELKPTEYILPDVLEDSEGTVINASKWFAKYSDLPGKRIGVVHGKTLAEFITCYKRLLKIGVDKIAFTFRGSLYESLTQASSLVDPRLRLMSWSFGRISVLEYMLDKGIINKDIPHHLLGCSLPQEFTHYKGKKFSWIESLDTSNPVVLGLDYSRYDDKGGISYKADSLLFERIDDPVFTTQREIIRENISAFRNLLK